MRGLKRTGVCVGVGASQKKGIPCPRKRGFWGWDFPASNADVFHLPPVFALVCKRPALARTAQIRSRNATTAAILVFGLNWLVSLTKDTASYLFILHILQKLGDIALCSDEQLQKFL